jgi:putative cardiolipin synthase
MELLMSSRVRALLLGLLLAVAAPVRADVADVEVNTNADTNADLVVPDASAVNAVSDSGVDIEVSALLYSSNRVQPLLAGQDALAARLDIVEHAQNSIDIQYYLYHDDRAGRLLSAALLRAADRGVKVRMLVDDIHGVDGRLMRILDAHPNIEVRCYNPFQMKNWRVLEMLLDFHRVDRRMHNKQLTVDSELSIVGGRNIGDEYFGSSDELAFADLDVLVQGPVVLGLENSFEAYWRSPRSKKIDRHSEAHKQKELAGLRQRLAAMVEQDGPALSRQIDDSAFMQARKDGEVLRQECQAAMLADSPEKGGAVENSAVARGIAQTLRNAQKDVLLLSAYFVPGEKGSEELEAARQHGVAVKVITNSLASTDVVAVHAGYVPYRKRLLEAGVELWEMKPVLAKKGRHHFSMRPSSRASLHTKAYFFDQRYLFIGSFNMDPRSAALNTEMGLLFDCPELAVPLEQDFMGVLPEIAYRVFLDKNQHLRWDEKETEGDKVYKSEPRAGYWRRNAVWWLKWLPLEREL